MIIAEIGNNHLGNLKKFCEMIRIAKESGANIVKAQAFNPSDIKTGSMPFEFYKQCALSINQYIDALEYARSIKIELFYSIFSNGFEELRALQIWNKITGNQFANKEFSSELDQDTTFFSVPNNCKMMWLDNAIPLFVTRYLEEDPRLKNINTLSTVYKRDAGLSDHTVGIETSIRAIRENKAKYIEKHFVLEKDKDNIYWNNLLFRDSVHAATPTELETISREFYNEN